ncbi:MAG: hypothetical protein FIB08_00240 [Candidatus Methanoperedens sp.]|nr:hypothetical protein [Candidatus Methanoperedens sp.]
MTLFNEMKDFSKIKEEINGWTLKPIDKNKVSSMELIELATGYAVEQFQWESYYKFLTMTQDKDIQKLFGKIAFQEEEHLSKIGSLADPSMTPMESSIALQMTAIHGFSEAAQLEMNDILKDTYDYILLDHLTQMKSLSDSASGMGSKGGIFETMMITLGAGTAAKTKAKPEDITKGTLQIMEGRPVEKQIIPMSAIFKQPLNKDTVDMASFVNAHTLLANEMQLRNEYQMFRRMIPSTDVRRLLNMGTAVENIHIVMLESLMDPTTNHLEHAMIGELMEIKNHRQGMQFAKSDSARDAHEYALEEDKEHLDWLTDVYSAYGSAAKFKATDKLFAMPKLSTSEYINQVAAATA